MNLGSNPPSNLFTFFSIPYLVVNFNSLIFCRSELSGAIFILSLRLIARLVSSVLFIKSMPFIVSPSFCSNPFVNPLIMNGFAAVIMVYCLRFSIFSTLLISILRLFIDLNRLFSSCHVRLILFLFIPFLWTGRNVSIIVESIARGNGELSLFSARSRSRACFMAALLMLCSFLIAFLSTTACDLLDM